MPWSLAADGFYNYTPTVSFSGKTTRIYYIAEGGDNTTATVNDSTRPWRTICRARKFTLSPVGSATRGARYTDASGAHYYVVDTISSAASILMIDNTPDTTPSGGTLTKVSGTGDAALTYTGTPTLQAGALWQWNIDRGGGGHDVQFSFPDWFSFRRGDTFERQTFETQISYGSSNLMGPDYTEPLLIGCYDPSITEVNAGWNAVAAGSPTFNCTINPRVSALARPKFTGNPFSAGTAGQGDWFYISLGGAGVSSNHGLNEGGNNIVIVGLEAASGGNQSFTNTAGQVAAFFRVEDCFLNGTWGTAINGAVTAHRTIFYNNGQPVEFGGPPVAYYDINGLGTLNKLKECVLDGATADGNFSHIIYGGGDADPWAGIDPGPMVFDGCIFSRAANGDIPYRSGGTVNNSLWIGCTTTQADLKVAVPGVRTTTISNNVKIHAGGGQLVSGYQADAVYVSNDFNQGPVVINNNICCHDSTTNGQAAITTNNNSNNWNISNNLFYKVCVTPGNTGVIESWSKSHTSVGGIIFNQLTITAGSGYTDKTININNVAFTTGTIQGSTRIYIATIDLATTTGWPWQVGILHPREGWVVLGGFTGAFSVLNGKFCRVYFGAGTGGFTNPVQLQGDFQEFATLPAYNNGTHAGKVYLPYLGRCFAGSSTGDGLRTDVYTMGGQVVRLGFGTDADDSNVAIQNGQSGGGYVVGDVLNCQGQIYNFEISSGTPVLHNTYTNNGQSFVFLYSAGANTYRFRGTGAPAGSGTLAGSPTLTFTSATHLLDADGVDIGTIPGGSSFSVTVGAVGTFTGAYNTNGNVTDTTGATSGSYLAPERTAGTYYDLIFGGSGHTDDDFCAATVAQSRQNWNRLLMAESFNDYIRQGFGKAMLGSAYADQYGGGSNAVLLGQAVM